MARFTRTTVVGSLVILVAITLYICFGTSGNDTASYFHIPSALVQTEVTADLSVAHLTPAEIAAAAAATLSSLPPHATLPPADIATINYDVSKSVTPLTFEFNTFTRQYEKIISEHNARGKNTNPSKGDAWSGPAPVCGIYKLFQLTGVVFEVRLLQPMQKLVIEKVHGSGCPEVAFGVRLESSNALVAGRVTRQTSSNSCGYDIHYTVLDAGEYVVDVRAVWLDPFGPDRTRNKTHPVTLRKTHSKFGKKPNQHYVYNKPCEEQTHIHGSPLVLTVTEEQLKANGGSGETSEKRCYQSNVTITTPGRWRRHDNSKESCSTPTICEGDPRFLNDAKPFNKDWVWTPKGCHYKVWKASTGPTHQCVKRRGLLMMLGDSTTREYAQNLRMFDLSKVGLKLYYANWKLEHQYFSRQMAQDALGRFPAELHQTKPVVVAVNLGPLHLIAGISTPDWEFYVDQWVKVFRDNQFPYLERKFFL
eukprot:PhF_6_TR39722/c0_g1_i5/m.59144